MKGNYTTDKLVSATWSQPAPTRNGFTWTTVYVAEMYRGGPQVYQDWLCEACGRAESQGHVASCQKLVTSSGGPQ